MSMSRSRPRGGRSVLPLMLVASLLAGTGPVPIAAQEMELPVPVQLAMISQIFTFDRAFHEFFPAARQEASLLVTSTP